MLFDALMRLTCASYRPKPTVVLFLCNQRPFSPIGLDFLSKPRTTGAELSEKAARCGTWRRPRRWGHRCKAMAHIGKVNGTLPSKAAMHAAPCRRFTVAEADGLDFYCGFTFFTERGLTLRSCCRLSVGNLDISCVFMFICAYQTLLQGNCSLYVHHLRLLDMRQGVNT